MTGIARVDRQLAVAAATSLPATVDAEFLSTVRALPVMLHTSGLAAASAYLLSRAGSGDGTNAQRYLSVVGAVLRDAAVFVDLPNSDAEPLVVLDALVADEARYRIAEQRARQFVIWLSRLATARRAPARPAPTRSDGAAS